MQSISETYISALCCLYTQYAEQLTPPTNGGSESEIVIRTCKTNHLLQFIGEAASVTMLTVHSQVVGGGGVSGLHTTVPGSGLHISVPSQVSISTSDTYSGSHWRVTVEPCTLLVTGPKAPLLMRLVKRGHSPGEYLQL